MLKLIYRQNIIRLEETKVKRGRINMENATKALLIAAAVLIAILLISLGVGVFNTASEQMSSANLTEYEIQQFNDKFKQYEGTDVTASKVNSMLKTVFNHNLAEEDAKRRVRVGLNGGGNSNGTDSSSGGTWLVLREQFWDPNFPTTLKTVPSGYRYTVKANYDSKTGLIYQIDVTTN